MTEAHRYLPMPRAIWWALGAAVAALMVAAAATLGSPRGSASSNYAVAGAAPARRSSTDPKAGELARCVKQSDPADADCQRVWENRRRAFFGAAGLEPKKD